MAEYKVTNFNTYKSLKKGLEKGMQIRPIPMNEGIQPIYNGIITIEGPRMPYVPAFTARCKVVDGFISWVALIEPEKEAA